MTLRFGSIAGVHGSELARTLAPLRSLSEILQVSKVVVVRVPASPNWMTERVGAQ